MESSTPSNLRERALLSIHRALIGEIDSNISAITAEIFENKIHLRVFVEGEILELQIENFDAGVITEIVADFPYPEAGDPQVKYEFLKTNSGDKLNRLEGLVFLKRNA